MNIETQVTRADERMPVGQDTRRCRSNSTKGVSDGGMSYAPVEAVQRALLVLRTLNDMRFASVGDVHRRTGISKSTIIRMLETMINEGYVVRDNFLGGYQLTSEVQALSCGYDRTPILIEAARSATVELAHEIKWPISIATPCDGLMVVNYTTNSISPWSFPFAVLHMRLQMTVSALGRCYFAFCDDAEREELISKHHELRYVDGAPHGLDRLNRSIEQVRKRGYATPDALYHPKRLQFVAVPIMHQGRAVAAMGTGYFRRAMPAGSVEKMIVEPMQEAAAKISAKLETIYRDGVRPQARNS